MLPPMSSGAPRRKKAGAPPRIAATATVEEGATLEPDTVVGVFCHVAKGAHVGAGSRIQSHTAVWAGVTLEADVFVGPSVTFTNVRHPRADFMRAGTARSASGWDETVVEAGASLGAGSILVAPVRVGARALVGAGAVVTRDVPSHAIVVGNPARVVGWACSCGETVSRGDTAQSVTCWSCGRDFPS